MHTPFRSWFLSTAVILSAQVLHGHDPGLSSAVVRVTDEGFEARLTFSPTDVEVLVPLDADRDGAVSRVEFETARTRITNALMDSFEIAVDDRAVPITTADVSPRIEEDNVQARLLFDTADGRRLTVRSGWLKQLPFGHRQYLAIVDRDGHELERRLLDAENPSVAVILGSDTTRATRAADAEFGSFFSLGVEHIVTGYDHLLFLLALLIGGGGLVASAKIITSFTVAHSITLAVAVLGLVEIPSVFVEAMIALSIIYVGAENLLGRQFGRRWVITFLFGLVHGFGFASILREVGLGTGAEVALPLLSFNVGVEFGQIVLALMIVPLIQQFRKRSTSFELCARLTSVAVVILGAHWLVERTVLL